MACSTLLSNAIKDFEYYVSSAKEAKVASLSAAQGMPSSSDNSQTIPAGTIPPTISEPSQDNSGNKSTNSDTYDSILKAELSGREHIGTKLHNGKTIGAGIDLGQNPKVGADALRSAGVSNNIVSKLLQGDKSVRITTEQVKDASKYMIDHILKELEHRIGFQIPEQYKAAVVLGQYYMYLRPSNNKTRNDLYNMVKAKDFEGYLNTIASGRGRVASEMRQRLDRAGIKY
ncbi:MAG: hypothetical protein JHC33_01340 [Ignisphaera sp.]|nr:hypothetical protein [Ignisphaera sp.]